MENCKQTAEKCKQIFENRKKLPPLKHILALPTLGQVCIVSEQQPFLSDFFQTEHPVGTLIKMHLINHVSLQKYGDTKHYIQLSINQRENRRTSVFGPKGW